MYQLPDGLLERAKALSEDDEAWTWWDADPKVAWGVTESYHGRVAALAREAGWEGCYHQDRSPLHFNVKLNGQGRWQGFNDRVREIAAERSEDFDTDRLREIASRIEQADIESWWYDLLPVALGEETGVDAQVYSCGRSGGYVQAPREILANPVALVKLGRWLGAEREAWNSREAGAYLAEDALEVYDEEKLHALASPRIDPLW